METEFEAEVVEVKARKMASGDKVVRIVLETEQAVALALQEVIAEKTVKVLVKSE